MSQAPHVAEVGRSLWADAWARLKANKAAVVSAYFLAFMACHLHLWALVHAPCLHHHLPGL